MSKREQSEEATAASGARRGRSVYRVLILSSETPVEYPVAWLFENSVSVHASIHRFSSPAAGGVVVVEFIFTDAAARRIQDDAKCLVSRDRVR